jgi:hypothetical protein
LTTISQALREDRPALREKYFSWTIKAWAIKETEHISDRTVHFEFFENGPSTTRFPSPVDN